MHCFGYWLFCNSPLRIERLFNIMQNCLGNVECKSNRYSIANLFKSTGSGRTVFDSFKIVIVWKSLQSGCFPRCERPILCYIWVDIIVPVLTNVGNHCLGHG